MARSIKKRKPIEGSAAEEKRESKPFEKKEDKGGKYFSSKGNKSTNTGD